MLKEDRQDKIVHYLKELGTATVAELARKLKVSDITIRRDLDALDEAKRIQRIHGGARCYSFEPSEPSFIRRQREQIEEKHAIAREACLLIKDDDVIALEAGTTTYALALAIASQSWSNLTVGTNSIEIARILLHSSGIRLILVGGVMQENEMACFGVLAQDMVRSLRFTRLFLGCRAFDIEAGLTHESDRDVDMVRAYVQSSDEVILLANHTKFGHRLPFRVLPPGDVDLLITDSFTSESVQKKLEAVVRVRLAQLSEAHAP